jgi:hypothetical protein
MSTDRQYIRSAIIEVSRSFGCPYDVPETAEGGGKSFCPVWITTARDLPWYEVVAELARMVREGLLGKTKNGRYFWK